MDKPKKCKLCDNNFKGHFNKIYCSFECKKKAKQNVNNKYKSKIKKIKRESTLGAQLIKSNKNVLEQCGARFNYWRVSTKTR